MHFIVFTKDYPARICYQAGNLPLGANIEIEAIALTGDILIKYVRDDSCLQGCKAEPKPAGKKPSRKASK